MFYSIQHVTKFRYSGSVSESMMELRMHPRSEGAQRCLSFQISVLPRARVAVYRDYLGNSVHHFDVPGHHKRLVIVAEALVDVREPDELPPSLGEFAWDALDDMIANGDYWEMLTPSHFARPSPELAEFAAEIGVDDPEEARERDLIEVVRSVSDSLCDAITYAKKSTRVDSPIEDAIRARQGVCQDYAHIMITLLRNLGVPARYVSGYLFHRAGDKTRSAEGATHAWVEVLIPNFGWVGFDPTNNVPASDRHVRTAVGRDYADVPPTKGVFKGSVESELAVTVRVAPSDAPPPAEEELGSSEEWSTVTQEDALEAALAHHQQQQQQ